MAGDGLAHGPSAAKKQAAVTTGSAKIIRHSCAMVSTVSFVVSPGPGLIARVAREIIVSARLTPASGRQDHTTSPAALATFVCYSVHRIPTSGVVTIAIRPLCRGGTCAPYL
jgi:hypothetical protein